MTITATEVNHRFGELMDRAQHEPVMVEKTGRICVVLISYEEYERLRSVEDAYWVAKAVQAEQSGHVGSDAAIKFLKR